MKAVGHLPGMWCSSPGALGIETAAVPADNLNLITIDYALADGVEVGSSHKVINLGCCCLEFNDLQRGKKVL